MTHRRTELIAFKTTLEDRAQLEAAAATLRLTLSEFIRRAVEDAVERALQLAEVAE